MAIVGEILDAIVDGMFKLDRTSLSAIASLLLSPMTLTVLILLVPTAS